MFTVHVKSELNALKDTAISSLRMVTNVVYSSVENNEKRLEMVIIVKYLLTPLLLFFFFFSSSPKLSHRTPFQHKIRSPLIRERHTIEWKTGQTTRFCVFVLPKPNPLGTEMLCSHPEEAGMEKLLCAPRFPGLGECERGGGLGPVPRAQLCPTFRSHYEGCQPPEGWLHCAHQEKYKRPSWLPA